MGAWARLHHHPAVHLADHLADHMADHLLRLRMWKCGSEMWLSSHLCEIAK